MFASFCIQNKRSILTPKEVPQQSPYRHLSIFVVHTYFSDSSDFTVYALYFYGISRIYACMHTISWVRKCSRTRLTCALRTELIFRAWRAC